VRERLLCSELGSFAWWYWQFMYNKSQGHRAVLVLGEDVIHRFRRKIQKARRDATHFVLWNSAEISRRMWCKTKIDNWKISSSVSLSLAFYIRVTPCTRSPRRIWSMSPCPWGVTDDLKAEPPFVVVVAVVVVVVNSSIHRHPNSLCVEKN
jgi:hypothetical protein